MGCGTAWGAWRPGCCPSGGRAFSNDRSGTETASFAPTEAERRGHLPCKQDIQVGSIPTRSTKLNIPG